jgi:hypothetical protein
MKVSDTALFCVGIFPQCFNPLGVKENQAVIKQVVNQVSDLKRS